MTATVIGLLQCATSFLHRLVMFNTYAYPIIEPYGISPCVALLGVMTCMTSRGHLRQRTLCSSNAQLQDGDTARPLRAHA
jgi:hypothetical protein